MGPWKDTEWMADPAVVWVPGTSWAARFCTHINTHFPCESNDKLSCFEFPTSVHKCWNSSLPCHSCPFTILFHSMTYSISSYWLFQGEGYCCSVLTFPSFINNPSEVYFSSEPCQRGCTSHSIRDFLSLIKGWMCWILHPHEEYQNMQSSAPQCIMYAIQASIQQIFREFHFRNRLRSHQTLYHDPRSSLLLHCICCSDHKAITSW